MQKMMAKEEVIKYAHSPVHSAVVRRDYVALRRIIAGLPRLGKAGEVKTEAQSIAEEQRVDARSAVIDRRDVPGLETALHLAVHMGDATAAELLMGAGADASLQNEQGWSALEEAVCAREEAIAFIIMRHEPPLGWVKMCRRLPRLVATMRRMRDFYMEISFHFESSLIPYIDRIAPSDTYKIWKRGSNMRVDLTLVGFEELRIQRSDMSLLFLGDGSEDGSIPPGSFCALLHKDKEIMNVWDGVGSQPSEVEIAQEFAEMSQTNMYRAGIDVTQAELIPQVNWRRQERAEMVGPWKAKIYDMHHVMLSVKSRQVPGAMELAASSKDIDNERKELEDYDGLLTEAEKRQLEIAMKMDQLEIGEDVDTGHQRSCYGREEFFLEEERSSTSVNVSKQNENIEGKGIKKEKKGWFTWGKRNVTQKNGKKTMVPPRSSLSDQLGDSNSRNDRISRADYKVEDDRKENEKDGRKSVSNDVGHENEYKKGLRPVLWLTPQFPLRTEELLPLLDILANKVKAIRRLRELLTTKLPNGTFPVKIAIPVVPTIRVIVTFTKFEELQPQDCDASQQSANSWFQWIKGPYNRGSGVSLSPESCLEEVQDPFVIPSDYTWTTMDEECQVGCDQVGCDQVRCDQVLGPLSSHDRDQGSNPPKDTLKHSSHFTKLVYSIMLFVTALLALVSFLHVQGFGPFHKPIGPMLFLAALPALVSFSCCLWNMRALHFYLEIKPSSL